MKTKETVLSALFTCLIIIGAFIRIPTPFAPITLQLPIVVLCALLLGHKGAFISSFLYILTGLIGLPVFANGGGISYILQPSFGYILGFLPCVLIVGRLSSTVSSDIRKYFAASLAGILTVHIIGLVYYILISRLYLGDEINISALIVSLCAASLPKDIALCGAVSAIGARLRKAIKQ